MYVINRTAPLLRFKKHNAIKDDKVSKCNDNVSDVELYDWCRVIWAEACVEGGRGREEVADHQSHHQPTCARTYSHQRLYV